MKNFFMICVGVLAGGLGMAALTSDNFLVGKNVQEILDLCEASLPREEICLVIAMPERMFNTGEVPLFYDESLPESTTH